MRVAPSPANACAPAPARLRACAWSGGESAVAPGFQDKGEAIRRAPVSEPRNLAGKPACAARGAP